MPSQMRVDARPKVPSRRRTFRLGLRWQRPRLDRLQQSEGEIEKLRWEKREVAWNNRRERRIVENHRIAECWLV